MLAAAALAACGGREEAPGEGLDRSDQEAVALGFFTTSTAEEHCALITDRYIRNNYHVPEGDLRRGCLDYVRAHVDLDPLRANEVAATTVTFDASTGDAIVCTPRGPFALALTQQNGVWLVNGGKLPDDPEICR